MTDRLGDNARRMTAHTTLSVRSGAITLAIAALTLTLPRATGINTRYAAATAETRALSTLHLCILDY